tara:strand:- start:11298 stop:11531 length:234 start_codon:yes stop_codon:yes gene_type:complete
MTRVLVITTDNEVYATYVETICFKEQFTNEQERDEAIQRAKSTAFSYALGFGHVYVNQIYLQGISTDQEIFNYLATN